MAIRAAPLTGSTLSIRYTDVVTYEAADQTAIDLIAVHGRDAVDVAMTCIRALLRCAEADAINSWLGIIEAIRTRLGC